MNTLSVAFVDSSPKGRAKELLQIGTASKKRREGQSPSPTLRLRTPLSQEKISARNDSFYDPPIFDGLCAFHLLGYTRSLSNARALHIPGGAIHLRAATHNPSP